MNTMLQSVFNLRRLRRPGMRIAVIIDDASDQDGAELVRCLAPWSSWLAIDSVFRIGPMVPACLFDALAANGCGAVLSIGSRPALAALIRRECARLRLTYVDAALPAKDSREIALLQEVVHHDAEIGGYNDWTDADPQASPWVLRMLSATQCRRHFPAWIVPHLAPLLEAADGRPLETLDIGCGAISRLRWGVLTGQLRVTGVDPLLDMYAVIRERHGLAALPGLGLAREIVANAEDLTAHLPRASYDLAYSANALDHTIDPPAIIDALASCVRPGGLVALEVYTREGSREHWWQLHQFDMYVDDHGRFVSESRDKVVTPLFPADGPFDVVDVPIRHDTVTALVARRKVTAAGAALVPGGVHAVA